MASLQGPATSKQLAYIRRLGGKPASNLSKQEAVRVIATLQSRRSADLKSQQPSPPKPKQELPGAPSLEALLQQLQQALYRNDHKSARLLEEKIDRIVFGRPWQPGI